jgi:hypothetical protein
MVIARQQLVAWHSSSATVAIVDPGIEGLGLGEIGDSESHDCLWPHIEETSYHLFLKL